MAIFHKLQEIVQNINWGSFILRQVTVQGVSIYYTKWEKACSGKLKKNAANAANFSTCTIIVTQHLKMTVDIIYAAAPITLLR